MYTSLACLPCTRDTRPRVGYVIDVFPRGSVMVPRNYTLRK